MNRYRQFGQLDDVPEVFGDVTFDRLDMKSDPATLPPGSLQTSENLRFDTNGLTVRGGLARQFPAGTSIGTIRFAAIYQPDGQTDRLALLTRTSLRLFNPADRSVTTYAYPAGELVEEGDAVDAFQASIGSGTLPGLYILRGFDKSVLLFDGSAITVAAAVPKAEFGLFYQNRMTVNDSRQSLKVSDFLNAGNWSPLNQFQIERGGADYLVGALAYQKDYVLIGARKKIFLAYFDPGLGTGNPYTGPLANTSFLRLLTGEAGPVGREALLEAAGLIWFITDNGIYAFQPQLDNQLTVLGQPLSADIQPIFRRLSAAYASGASVKRYGYRLYFALPISDEPVKLAAVSIENTVTTGADLPQNLPFNLATASIATFTTAARHNLTVGDRVQLSGIAGGSLNGEHAVTSVPDDFTFTCTVDAAGDVILGSRATMTKLAVRNNCIAVFNLNNRAADHPLGAWESIDTLPVGFYADWLRIADFGAQRRLWIVDAEAGPALYEEGTVDEVGDVIGGVSFPFVLPVDLSAANFASVPIPGRAVSRAYRWTGNPGSYAYGRRVRQAEARLTLGADDAGTLFCRVRTPNRPVVEQSATVTGAANQPDRAVSRRLAARGLEAELEFVATSGRPTVRALEVQVMRSGEY